MINLNINLDELFRYSEELLLYCGREREILYLNAKAISVFGNISSIKDIEHLFSFDVCVLDKEKIYKYTPLSEAFSSGIPVKAEILLQTAENKYTKFNLRTFKNNGNTLILLSDVSSQEKEQRITALEKENKDFIEVKERAQNLAIRAGLINRISNSIRESLKIEEIIKIIINEVTTTLGLDRGYFTYIDELSGNEDNVIIQSIEERKPIISSVMAIHKPNNLQPRLVMPVLYQDKVIGIMVFYHVNNKKTWHEDEISLIEGITAQLASAINQSRAQTQLIQAEKMASLGQLVAGVAHEVNTPLGSINSNNDIFSKCIKKISGPDNILEIFNETISTNFEAIKRINQLVKSLKNFARLDEAEYQESDLHEGLKNTLLLINHEIKDRIEIIRDFGELPPVKCYPNQLNQVFMNIIVNAYQSIKGRGSITIKTEKITGKVIITISDTGQGIAKEQLTRIFDPGFTTKSVGVGTGLGLSICYQIIEKHNGKIFVDSEQGKGSIFKIELPIT